MAIADTDKRDVLGTYHAASLIVIASGFSFDASNAVQNSLLGLASDGRVSTANAKP